MIALSTTSIAWLLFAVILIGWIVYALLNIRQSRAELGSEIELAANRKPYYDDETLEGPRLDRVLGLGVVLLAITVIALPIYWILEPDRQAGAQAGRAHRPVATRTALLRSPGLDHRRPTTATTRPPQSLRLRPAPWRRLAKTSPSSSTRS